LSIAGNAVIAAPTPVVIISGLAVNEFRSID
jgi:hypothetical protein